MKGRVENIRDLQQEVKHGQLEVQEGAERGVSFSEVGR